MDLERAPEQEILPPPDPGEQAAGRPPFVFSPTVRVRRVNPLVAIPLGILALLFVAALSIALFLFLLVAAPVAYLVFRRRLSLARGRGHGVSVRIRRR